MRNNLEYSKAHNILKYFLLLIPILLITGPFLSDLSISILAICSFIFIKEKNIILTYFRFHFLYFGSAFYLVQYYQKIKFYLLKVVYFISDFIFSIFFWYLIEKDRDILENLFKVLFFSFSILIIDSFYQSLNGINLLNMELLKKSCK